MELKTKTTVRTEVLLDVLDALADNCNFFACEGSIFPPLHMKTCRNCRAAWEIQMIILGYSKDDMENIERMYEKVYWRVYKRMENCTHENLTDDEMFEKPCPDCHKEWGGENVQELSHLRRVLKENKPVRDSVERILVFLEEHCNCEPDKRLKDLL